MKRFRGFTLTELMVALAVIGIIVAVVTPAVMRNRPNKNKMMIKKSFYLTEQIVSELINDERIYPDKTDVCYDDASTDTCYWGFDDTSEAGLEGVDYSGASKFAALFKSKLNVSKDIASCTEIGSTDFEVCPIFYTNDGIKWDLSGTDNAWESDKDEVGTFDDTTAGLGKILIDVNGEGEPNCRSTGKDYSGTACDGTEDDFDQYVIQILANGKMRIDPDDTKAVEYATINTSIKDNM